jgi:hypothetical protein
LTYQKGKPYENILDLYDWMTTLMLVRPRVLPRMLLPWPQFERMPPSSHIGVLWWITGDDDLDSFAETRVSPTGRESLAAWSPAMRAYPTIICRWVCTRLDYWAASAMFLVTGTTYQPA